MARLTFDSLIEDAANAPLEVFAPGDGSVSVSAMSFPAPPLETVTAGSISTEGDLVAARRHQNRQIGLTLEVLEPQGAAATNLIANPSFENLPTGGLPGGYQWGTHSTGGAAAPAVTILDNWASQGGDRHLYCVSDDHLVSGQAAGVVTGAGVGDPILVTAGLPYSGRCRAAVFGGLSSGTSFEVLLEWTDGANVVVSYSSESLSVAAPAELDFAFANKIAPAGATRVRVYVRIGNGGTQPSADSEFRLDDVVLVQSATPPAYFDGDTPGCYWNGAPHASTSTRPASGGPRFRATVADIEAKVAKIAAAGGTLRWINDDGDSFTFDLEAADQYDVPYDIGYFAGPVAQITVGLIAKPYARGPEVAGTAHPETTLPVLSFTETAIGGDVPALGRLVVSEDQSQSQSYLLWGLESRDYSSAATAAAWLQAEAGTAGASAAVATMAGASGGATNNTMAITALTSTPSTIAMFDATRVGEFRVFARVWLPGIGNAGSVSLRLRWDVNVNPAVTIDPGLEGDWLLVDVGMFRWYETSRALPTLELRVQAASTVNDDDVYLDGIVVVPTAEGYGEVNGLSTFVLFTGQETEITHEGVLSQEVGTNIWKTPAQLGNAYGGDYLLVPHTRDGGTVHIVVKASRLTGVNQDRVIRGDGAIDDISAQLFWTPRYLSIR